MDYYKNPLKYNLIPGEYTPVRYHSEEQNKNNSGDLDEVIANFHQAHHKNQVTNTDLKGMSNEELRELRNKNPIRFDAMARYQGVKLRV